ncbi:MAG: riboflavin biosynthesis protein RibF [Candidatus Gastranaerophilales bacterium]|nr:riboflavin biosynthesis protein RibF [Candidatus Gastranaerophilales bacterium]
MIVLDKLPEIFQYSSSLALGFFDGLHLGHQKVIQNAIDMSKQLCTKSVILTFQNHPVELLYNVKPEFIKTPDERIKLFQKLGVDIVVMPEFSRDIAILNAQQYFDQIIMKFNPKSITTGFNHHFGSQQSGNSAFFIKKSKEYDFIFREIEAVKIKNEIISSTLIRNAIKAGDVEIAAKLLLEPYKIKNMVKEGDKRGKTLGYPTANLEIPENKIAPKAGVYFGYVSVGNIKYKAVANAGFHPTFNIAPKEILEVHILDFDRDIYGETIEFTFIEKLRDEIKFKTAEALKEQMALDVAKAGSL